MEWVSKQKPPLGIKPRMFVLENRLREIDGAMIRYIKASMSIPEEWLEERNEIILTLQGIRKDG